MTSGARGRGPYSSDACSGAVEDDPAHDASREEKDCEELLGIAGGRTTALPLPIAAAAKGMLRPSVVAVREARIDAARLIHSIIVGTSSKRPGAAAGTAAPASSRRGGSRTDPSPSRSRMPRRSRPSSFSCDSASPAAVGGDEDDDELPTTPQEECMEFELIVRLESATGCWSFETTRRFECFLELRRELARELRPSPRSHCGNPPSSSPPSPSGGGCCVPPVPRVQHDEAFVVGGGALACGNAGRGFVFLQALIRSYVPVLEDWLRTVLERLPVSDPTQSYALSNFLCQRRDDRDDEGREALSVPSSSHSQPRSAPFSSVSVSPSQSASSFRPLDSIEESEEVEC